MSENLFPEFESASKKVWKRQVLKELKVEPYDKLILNLAGLKIEPYYTREEAPCADATKIIFPEKSHIRQDFEAQDFQLTNRKILTALENGVNALGIHVHHEISVAEMEILLKDVFFEMISFHFVSENNIATAADAFFQLAENKKANRDLINGSFFSSNLLLTENSNIETLRQFLKKYSLIAPSFKFFIIDIDYFEADNNLFFEKFTHKIHEAMKHMNELQQTANHENTIARHTQFSVTIGVEYFAEIAKLRALRILWNNMLEKMSMENIPAFIQVEKSWKHNCADEPNKNMIRHTTEAMSALIGGCDVLFLKSTDQTDQLSNEFFQRITTNIQHILQNESHFDAVTDPAAGSYFIENITRKFVEQVKM